MVQYEEKLTKIKEILDSSIRPLILFDDDCDGVCSFLLIYRYLKEGKGVIIKSTPHITEKYLKKVEEYQPDVVFILDIAEVDQDFIDKIKVKIVWIDHHELSDAKAHNLTYFNPKQIEPEANQPTSYWCYRIVKKEDLLWLGTVGAIGDWYVPSYISEFKEKYPDYVTDRNGEEQKEVGDILYKTKLGKMCHLINFVIKGKTKDVATAISVLTRIVSPNEILNQETSKGKFLLKRYSKMNEEYKKLLSSVKKKKESGVILFKYPSTDTSFTAEISNELMYKYPDELIVIARQKGDEMKISLRSNTIDLPKAVAKSLVGVSGYGGGHKKACGACVKIDDFDTFLENLKENSKDENKSDSEL
jgi:single-stranded DNA-specific DHH superfamily exonuclease